MQTDNRFLDDMAKLATSALGVAQGAREEMENMFRQRFERLIASMDLVPREEFEAVKAMAVAAREENEALAARLAALEARLAKPATARRPARKTAAKPKVKKPVKKPTQKTL
jgi:BMFP domain-containing protein YqiC